jgi:hypothetical protein
MTKLEVSSGRVVEAGGMRRGRLMILRAVIHGASHDFYTGRAVIYASPWHLSPAADKSMALCIGPRLSKGFS